MARVASRRTGAAAAACLPALECPALLAHSVAEEEDCLRVWSLTPTSSWEVINLDRYDLRTINNDVQINYRNVNNKFINSNNFYTGSDRCGLYLFLDLLLPLLY